MFITPLHLYFSLVTFIPFPFVLCPSTADIPLWLQPSLTTDVYKLPPVQTLPRNLPAGGQSQSFRFALPACVHTHTHTLSPSLYLHLLVYPILLATAAFSTQ